MPVRQRASLRSKAGGFNAKGVTAMKRITTCFALLSIAALALFAPSMLGQNQQYPIQFSPLRTFRPRPVDPPPPLTKFVKASSEGIPNAYIVILDDRAVPQASSRAGLKAKQMWRTSPTALLKFTAGKLDTSMNPYSGAFQLRCLKRRRLLSAGIHR